MLFSGWTAITLTELELMLLLLCSILITQGVTANGFQINLVVRKISRQLLSSEGLTRLLSNTSLRLWWLQRNQPLGQWFLVLHIRAVWALTISGIWVGWTICYIISHLTHFIDHLITIILHSHSTMLSLKTSFFRFLTMKLFMERLLLSIKCQAATNRSLQEFVPL